MYRWRISTGSSAARASRESILRAGGDLVKVFPCGQVGADSYIRTLIRSLPQIPLVAAGGVNQQNAEAFILAGATAIGVGTQLIPTESIQRRQAKSVQELALRFLKRARSVKKLPTVSASRISAVHCGDT